MPTTVPEEIARLNPAAFIDHTLLKPDATRDQIKQLCEEAVEAGFASVCIPPAFVPLVHDCLYGSEVKVGSVVGFPCGYHGLRQKVQEAAELAAAGAQELDMVIWLAPLLEGRFAEVEEEIAQIVLAAPGTEVKVIIECCYLTAEQKKKATELVIQAGGAYVKTSTGFGPGGAAQEDVVLLARAAAGQIGVKAAGGIRDLEFCHALLAAGATRIGSSAGLKIVQQWQSRYGAVSG